MKNERRKQLSQNSLAKYLEETVNSAKDNSATISRFLLVILIALVLFLAWKTFATKNKQGFANDIKQLVAYNMLALDEKQFDNVIKEYFTKYPSGENNATINLLTGDIYYNRASGYLSQGNRDKAIDDFEKALEYYTVADNFQFKQQDSAESAVWGLAQTNETLAALKEGTYFANAKDLYQRLCETWPEGAHFDLAAQQLDWLNRPVAVAFLEKYRTSDPVIFAPDMQIPGMTSPDGDLDRTIVPGESPSFVIPGNEYDAGLAPPEEPDVESATQESIQEPIQEQEMPEPTPVPANSEVEPADSEVEVEEEPVSL